MLPEWQDLWVWCLQSGAYQRRVTPHLVLELWGEAHRGWAVPARNEVAQRQHVFVGRVGKDAPGAREGVRPGPHVHIVNRNHQWQVQNFDNSCKISMNEQLHDDWTGLSVVTFQDVVVRCCTNTCRTTVWGEQGAFPRLFGMCLGYPGYPQTAFGRRRAHQADQQGSSRWRLARIAKVSLDLWTTKIESFGVLTWCLLGEVQQTCVIQHVMLLSYWHKCCHKFVLPILLSLMLSECQA